MVFVNVWSLLRKNIFSLTIPRPVLTLLLPSFIFSKTYFYTPRHFVYWTALHHTVSNLTANLYIAVTGYQLYWWYQISDTCTYFLPIISPCRAYLLTLLVILFFLFCYDKKIKDCSCNYYSQMDAPKANKIILSIFYRMDHGLKNVSGYILFPFVSNKSTLKIFIFHFRMSGYISCNKWLANNIRQSTNKTS